MKTYVNTIGSACGKFVEYQWFVVNNGAVVASGFSSTIEKAQKAADKAAK